MRKLSILLVITILVSSMFYSTRINAESDNNQSSVINSTEFTLFTQGIQTQTFVDENGEEVTISVEYNPGNQRITDGMHKINYSSSSISASYYIEVYNNHILNALNGTCTSIYYVQSAYLNVEANGNAVYTLHYGSNSSNVNSYFYLTSKIVTGYLAVSHSFG